MWGSIVSVQLRVSISIGCGTKTGATNGHQRRCGDRTLAWAYIPDRKRKRRVRHTDASKTGQRGSMLNMFVRDLGDNVLFAFGPSWRPSEVAIRFSSSVHELTDDYKQLYLPFNFLGNLY